LTGQMIEKIPLDTKNCKNYFDFGMYSYAFNNLVYQKVIRNEKLLCNQIDNVQ